MPWRPVERRLPCQMNCRKVWDRALRAVRGRSAEFLQNIARADMLWSAVWRGSRRSMDTNRCHRASGCALEARRTAIALLDELQVSVGPGSEGRAWQFHVIRRASCKTSRERICLGVLSGGVRGARWTQIDAIARADMPWSAVWRGSRRSMDTNRRHRASGYALECCLEGFAVLDRLNVPAMTLREIHLEP